MAQAQLCYYTLIGCVLQRQDTVTMGACCGGMKTSQHKSLPENEKANNVEEMDKCANGPQGDAAVDKETPVTADQQQQPPPDQEASVNHTADHAQPSPASPEDVELKITEPDRPEPEPAPAVCPVADKPTVCPPAPAFEPTVTDAGVEEDQNKLSTEVLPASQDDHVTRLNDESTSGVTTTRDEHTQLSCVVETTEVRPTAVVDEALTSANAAWTTVQQDEDRPEVGEVGDVQPVKVGDDVVTSPDAETVQTSSSVVEQISTSVEASASTDEADHAPTAMTGGTDDEQKQADTDVVMEAPAADVILAASVVDQQESAPLPPPPATEQAERLDEQLSTPTAPVSTEAVDVPAATVCEEPGAEAAKDEAAVVELGEQPVHLQQQPATDDVEATSEQTPTAANVEEALSSAETPVNVGEQAEVTAVSHEEQHPAAEELAPPEDVEASNVPHTENELSSDDVALPTVDDSASKPEDALSSSVAGIDVVGDIQPEELPPPPTPEKEDAAVPAVEEVQQAPATDCFRYVEPPTDTTEQPDQHADQHAVNGYVDNFEEPTSKSTSEATDHVDEVPVTGEP